MVRGDVAARDREVERLQNVLEQMIRQIEKMMPLFARERELLIARQAEALEKNSDQIEAALNELYRMDREREAVMAPLLAQVGLTPDNGSLKQLHHALGGRSALLEYRERLSEVTQRAEKANQENKAVYQGVMMATEAFLGIVRQSMETKNSGYDRFGQKNRSSAYSLFSRKL